MTDKAKTGPLYRKLNELAPYPPAEYAKAAEVVRWLAAQGLLSDARAQSGNDQFPPPPDHAHLVGAQLAAAYFLTGMTQLAEMMTDPAAGRTVATAADIMAAEVVGAWNGGDLGAVLWNLAGDDAEAICATTKELAAAMSDGPGAASADQLRADLGAVMPYASFTGAPLAAVQRLLVAARYEDVTHA